MICLHTQIHGCINYSTLMVCNTIFLKDKNLEDRPQIYNVMTSIKISVLKIWSQLIIQNLGESLLNQLMHSEFRLSIFPTSKSECQVHLSVKSEHTDLSFIYFEGISIRLWSPHTCFRIDAVICARTTSFNSVSVRTGFWCPIRENRGKEGGKSASGIWWIQARHAAR